LFIIISAKLNIDITLSNQIALTQGHTDHIGSMLADVESFCYLFTFVKFPSAVLYYLFSALTRPQWAIAAIAELLIPSVYNLNVDF